MPRVAVVGLWHETNSWSARPATLADFTAFELLSGSELGTRNAGTGTVIGGFLDSTELDVMPVFSAGAWPSGPVSAATLDTLLDRMRAELAAIGPVDGLLVNLHGAMVSEDCADVEGRTAAMLRDVVGDAPIAAVLDLHANVSPRLAELVDILISYDTYPHVDMRERGREAAELLARRIAGENLTTVLAKTPLLTCPLAQGTEDQPMRSLLARARARAAAAGVERICVTAGFPYSDTPGAGFSVLVVCHADNRAVACRVAEETVADIEAAAAAFAVERPDPATAVRQALALDLVPVVLADVADNVGGGSAGDGTALLAELIAQRAPDAVVVIADPEVALAAHAAGQGARIRATVGARTDRLHGEPVSVTDAEVVALSDGNYVSTGSWQTGRHFTLGRTAVLRVGGVRIVVTEYAVPPFHRDQLTILGIDPARVGVIVAKGAIAWRAAFPDAAASIEVDGPGACPIRIETLTRRHPPRKVVAR